MPTFSSKPITLMGIPYLIRVKEIFCDIFGFTFPMKKPKIKKGIISINKLKIVFKKSALYMTIQNHYEEI